MIKNLLIKTIMNEKYNFGHPNLDDFCYILPDALYFETQHFTNDYLMTPKENKARSRNFKKRLITALATEYLPALINVESPYVEIKCKRNDHIISYVVVTVDHDDLMANNVYVSKVKDINYLSCANDIINKIWNCAKQQDAMICEYYIGR